MRRLLPTCCLSVLCLLAGTARAGAVAPGAPAPAAFEVVALGVAGGLDDGNLSAYLVRAPGAGRYLALDAGTLLPGIARAAAQGAFADAPASGQGLDRAGLVLREQVAGYFISHAHLDHVAGLLIASTDDTGPKPVYGLPQTLDTLSQDYLNWQAWPNFADRGPAPALGRYQLRDTAPGQCFAVAGTGLSGCVHPLWHDRVVSSMVLLQAGGAYYAYFGDTGPDALSGGGHRLAQVWAVLAPLVRSGALKGLQIEVSYPDDVPDAQLFGHLTPAWLLRELHALAAAAGGPRALAGVTVVVDHIKPSLAAGRDPRALIAAQLAAGNDLGVRFVLPEQGQVVKIP